MTTRRLRPLTPLILLLGVGAVALHLGTAPPAGAAPPWGGACLSCHGEWADGAIGIVGSDGLADPDESATGAPDRGSLSVFRVRAGEVTTLFAEVALLGAGDRYAVELSRLRHPGVVGGSLLDFGEDCDWAYWGEPGRYYTDPTMGYGWGAGPTLFHYELIVPADAPSDHYDLVLAVAGKRAADGALFAAEQHFYLEVIGDGIFADGFEGGDMTAWSEAVAEKGR